MLDGRLLYVFLASLLPTFEGRYAYLVGLAMGLRGFEAAAVSALGVVVLAAVLPLVLPLVDRAAELAAGSRHSLVSSAAKVYRSYLGRVRRKAGRYMDRYGVPGLALFVAAPFPATGVWTGALAAYVLGMSKAKSVIALVLGGLLSIMLVAAASAPLAG